MRYPQFLQPGGRLGFIAPSFGCTTEPYVSCFRAALARFREAGYRTVAGPNCWAGVGVGKSNTPQNCAAEINLFLTGGSAVNTAGADPDAGAADVVISCGGGETMCEDLTYVDFDAIRRAKPRWFMGYSDNTNLTFTLTTLCDTAAIYGPNAPAFGMAPLHGSLNDALLLLTGQKLVFENYPYWERESLKTAEAPLVPYNLTEPCGVRVLQTGAGKHGSVDPGGPDTNDGNAAAHSVTFSGRLIGGCLDCLINLCGTPYDNAVNFAENYAADGIIWFLEACDLSPMGIRRGLWQLRQSGWFRHAAGFIFGRPYLIDSRFGTYGPQDAVRDALSGLNVPVVVDADIGHLPPMLPVISGAYAEVSAADGHFRIEYILK